MVSARRGYTSLYIKVFLPQKLLELIKNDENYNFSWFPNIQYDRDHMGSWKFEKDECEKIYMTVRTVAWFYILHCFKDKTQVPWL